MDPYEVTDARPRAFSTNSIDLTRSNEDVLPFNIYTGEDIQRSGSRNLAEFFRTNLSQNFNPRIPEEQVANGYLGYSLQQDSTNQLNLANGAGGAGALGSKEVVILVDGRRLPTRRFGAQDESTTTSGNFSGIPVASIERIEFLTSAASAIYGEGATGGVINIRLH